MAPETNSFALPRRAVLAAGLALAGGAAAPAAPRRIVSLNPCVDVILVQLVEARRIAALSHYSCDPNGSTIAGLARRLPSTPGTAESVVALDADLVLVGGPGSEALNRSLARLGIASERFNVPETIAASLAQIRHIARLVGEPLRGETLIARIQSALIAAVPPSGHRPVRALIYMPGGFVSGPGTLMDELLTRAGFTNAATHYGLTRSGTLPLERLIADPPDVLLSGRAGPGSASRAERVLAHPALASVRHRMVRADFPQAYLFCAGPVLIPAIDALVQARRSVRT